MVGLDSNWVKLLQSVVFNESSLSVDSEESETSDVLGSSSFGWFSLMLIRKMAFTWRSVECCCQRLSGSAVGRLHVLGTDCCLRLSASTGSISASLMT